VKSKNKAVSVLMQCENEKQDRSVATVATEGILMTTQGVVTVATEGILMTAHVREEKRNETENIDRERPYTKRANNKIITNQSNQAKF
jgi:hypothetical protein